VGGRRLAAAALAVLAVDVFAVSVTPQPPLARQPAPDAQEYFDSASQLRSGHGYVTSTHDPLAVHVSATLNRPRYPPGLPIMMALVPARTRQHVFPKAVGILLVTAVWILGWEMGGPVGASVASVLVVASPFLRQSALLVMSDGLSALLTVAVALTVRRYPRLAGFLAGFAVVVRLSNGVLLVAALAVARDRRRLAMWSVPPMACLVAYQWAAFGSPLHTGYVAHTAEFGLHYVLPGRLTQSGIAVPNLVYYPGLLLGLFPAFFPFGVSITAVIEAWWRRRSAEGTFFFVLGGTTLVVFIPYFFRDSRFVAAPAMIEAALVGAVVARFIRWASRWPRRGRRDRNSGSPRPPCPAGP
jgi:hypothetical protein